MVELTLDNLNDLTKAVDEYGNQFLRKEISFEEFKERFEQRHAEFGCPVGGAYVAWEKLLEHVEEAWNKNNKKPKSDPHEDVINAQQKFSPTFCVSRTFRKRTTSCARATNLSTIAEDSSSNLSHESINNPQHENRDAETSDFNLEEPRSKKKREEIPREYLLRRSERVAKFPIVPYFETGHRRRSAPAPNAVKPANKKNSKVNTRQRTVPAIKPTNKKNGKVNTAPRRSRQRVRFEETPPSCSTQQPEAPTQEAAEEEEVTPSQEEIQIEQEPAPVNDSLPNLSTTAEATDSNKLIEAFLAQQKISADLFKQQNEILDKQTIANEQLLKLLEFFPKRD